MEQTLMSATSMYMGCRHSKRNMVAMHHRHGAVVTQYGSPGMRCRSAEPPPAADYQRWLDEAKSKDRRAGGRNTLVTGEKLRRAVRMIRNGYSMVEIQRSVGSVRDWVKRLPDELAP